MEKIVHVEYLRSGVFVSRLDRPWLGTPFSLEGVLLKTPEQIRALRRYCTYVYIDTLRGDDVPGSVDAAHYDASLTQGVTWAAITAPDMLDYTVAFEQEVETARHIQQVTDSFVHQALNDARLGGSIDTGGAKRLVQSLVHSIVRNPDALLFLTQLKDKDHYTTQHCFNVCVLSLAFGHASGLSEAELNILGTGALLHDIGKMKVPPEILNKPGTLTEEEFAIIKEHVNWGVEILHGSRDVPWGAIDVVHRHHERHDGSGYPGRLQRGQIGAKGVMTSIADVYDAMTSERVYHAPVTSYEALKRLYEWRGKAFDESMVLFFIRCIGVYPVGTLVEINDGDVGLVISSRPRHRLTPRVRLILDKHRQPYERAAVVDLMERSPDEAQPRLSIRRVVDAADYGIDLRACLLQEFGSAAVPSLPA